MTETAEGSGNSLGVQKERESTGKRKLIRDGYLKIFKKKPGPWITRTALDNDEYHLLLDEKLDEEAREWMVSRDPMELVDVMEAIDAECITRTRKYTLASLKKNQESDIELIKAIGSVVKNGVTDMDIFNGMFLLQIEKWSQTHDFKELARVLGMVYAAGRLSTPQTEITGLERKKRTKYERLGGFFKRVVSEPQEVV
jgi:predicted house-cleaning noncanonical NTP pyrophosphatase (MazG superfamily)